MYKDDTTLRDVFDIIEIVVNSLGTISSNQCEICSRIDNIEKSAGDIEKTISEEFVHLTEMLYVLLNETKKTNILLKKAIKTNDVANAIKFDSKKLANRSFVVINDSFLTAKEYAKTITDNVNKGLSIIDKRSSAADIAGILSNAKVNDYFLVNCNCLTDFQKYMIMTAILDNSICFTIGKGDDKREMKIDLKPINFIIYSDLIELIPPKIIEELDIVT